MKGGAKLAADDDRIDRFKTLLEIVALAIGSIFLCAKLIDGEAHSAMQVSLELERKPTVGNCNTELLAAKLGLLRSAVGRLKLSEIKLTVSNPQDTPSTKKSTMPTTIVDKGISHEREREDKGEDPAPWIYLPPNEGTVLGYFATIEPGVPVVVEATIATERTVFGLWTREQEWRASAVSLPGDAAQCASNTSLSPKQET